MPFKLVLVPSLIGLVSLAGRRWGPSVSGLLASLPWTSGPVLLFLALEHGSGFAAEAAVGTLGGVLSLTGFCLSYAWAARRAGWAACTGVGIFVYILTVLAQMKMQLSLPVCFASVGGALALSSNVMPNLAHDMQRGPTARGDIPLRMAIATLLVILLTATAEILGARLSGLLAPFPVFASILTVFSHHNEGSGAAVRILMGIIQGSFSFAVFFLVASIAFASMGITGAFLVATVSAASFHGILLGTVRSSRTS